MKNKVLLTDSTNKDFITLTNKLDEELHEIYGELQKQFDKFNKLSYIKDVLVLYMDNVPVGCGAFKQYSDSSIELKRIFVKKEYRGQQMSKLIVNTLEDIVRKQGYKYSILETGTKQGAAVNLYKTLGYSITENYEPYIGNVNSICMKKCL